jgi:hypothetical protein
VIDWLIIFCAVLALWQRKWSAILFVSPTVAHAGFLSGLDGWAYYAGAATVDVVTIAILSSMKGPSELTVWLQKAAFVSVLLNGFGWVLWALYLPPGMYDVAFVVLWFAIILTIVSTDDDGGYPRLTSFSLARFGGLGHHLTNKGQA